jgi:hypothetical protein
MNSAYATKAKYFEAGDNPFLIPATAINIFTCWIQIWLQMFGNLLQNFGLRIREIVVLIIIPFTVILVFLRQLKHSDYKKSNVMYLLVMTFAQTFFLTFLALKAGHCISLRPVYINFSTPYAMLLLSHSIIAASKIPSMKNTMSIAAAAIIIIMIVSLI